MNPTKPIEPESDFVSEKDFLKCPECGAIMLQRGAIGIDKNGREMEADWLECAECGYTS